MSYQNYDGTRSIPPSNLTMPPAIPPNRPVTPNDDPYGQQAYAGPSTGQAPVASPLPPSPGKAGGPPVAETHDNVEHPPPAYTIESGYDASSSAPPQPPQPQGWANTVVEPQPQPTLITPPIDATAPLAAGVGALSFGQDASVSPQPAAPVPLGVPNVPASVPVSPSAPNVPAPAAVSPPPAPISEQTRPGLATFGSSPNVADAHTADFWAFGPPSIVTGPASVTKTMIGRQRDAESAFEYYSAEIDKISRERKIAMANVDAIIDVVQQQRGATWAKMLGIGNLAGQARNEWVLAFRKADDAAPNPANPASAQDLSTKASEHAKRLELARSASRARRAAGRRVADEVVAAAKKRDTEVLAGLLSKAEQENKVRLARLDEIKQFADDARKERSSSHAVDGNAALPAEAESEARLTALEAQLDGAQRKSEQNALNHVRTQVGQERQVEKNITADAEKNAYNIAEEEKVFEYRVDHGGAQPPKEQYGQTLGNMAGGFRPQGASASQMFKYAQDKFFHRQ